MEVVGVKETKIQKQTRTLTLVAKPGRLKLLRASRPSEARSPVRSERLSRKMQRSGEGLVPLARDARAWAAG